MLRNMSDQGWWLHKLLHSVLDDEQTMLRIITYVCKGWLFQYDDMQTCITTFFTDIYFAPIELVLTEEHIGFCEICARPVACPPRPRICACVRVGPKVNSLLALNLYDLFTIVQLGHIRDLPKQAGSLFSLRVGVVADRPMWVNCTINKQLDESTGNRLQLLRAFVKTLVEEVTKSYQHDDNMCTHVLQQLRTSLMGAIDTALYAHSCDMPCRIKLLEATREALAKQTHVSAESMDDMWTSIRRDVSVSQDESSAVGASA